VKALDSACKSSLLPTLPYFPPLPAVLHAILPPPRIFFVFLRRGGTLSPDQFMTLPANFSCSILRGAMPPQRALFHFFQTKTTVLCLVALAFPPPFFFLSPPSSTAALFSLHPYFQMMNCKPFTPSFIFPLLSVTSRPFPLSVFSPPLGERPHPAQDECLTLSVVILLSSLSTEYL